MEAYARLHAWFHGLFQPTDHDIAREVFDRVSALARKHGLANGHDPLVATIPADIVERLEANDVANIERALIARLVAALLDFDDMFVVAEIDWSQRRSISELWGLRDALTVQQQLLENYDSVTDAVATAVTRGLLMVADSVPRLPSTVQGGISIPTRKLDRLPDLGTLLEQVIRPFFDEDIVKLELFPRLRSRLYGNVIAASGGNPEEPQKFSRAPRWPSKSDIADRRELVETYVGGTPLMQCFDGTVDFVIPTRTRFEHHHMSSPAPGTARRRRCST
jgi:hypothetical protein